MAAKPSAPAAPAKKAATEPVFDRSAGIRELRDQICRDTKNPYAIQTSDQFVNTFGIRRSCGITSVDLACGGGFPIGGITRVQGKASGGKNYLSNCIFREVQSSWGDQAALGAVGIEIVFDKEYAQKCGAKIALSDQEIEWKLAGMAERGYPLPPPELVAKWREQIGFFEHSVPDVAESALGNLLKMVAKNVFHAVSADSFGALLTEGEDAKDLDDPRRVGDVAGLVTRFMNRMLPILNKRDSFGRQNATTIIIIDQHREKIDTRGAFDNDAGINALRHGKLLDIQVTSGRNIFLVDGGAYGPENPVVGKKVHWKIVKAKAGAHEGPFGEYDFYFGEHGYGFGVDVHADLIRTGTLHGVIDRAGAWYSHQGRRLGQGEVKAAASVAADPQWYFEIRNEIFRKAGVSFLSKEPW